MKSQSEEHVSSKSAKKANEEYETYLFSSNFASLRASKGLTKKQMAEMLSISPTTVSAYEAGEKSPTLQTAAIIARKCNVSLDWLCGITVKPTDGSGTYSDVISALIKISKIVPTEVYSVDEHRDSWGMIKITEPIVTHFIKEWEKIKPLFDSHTIGSNLYDPWIANALQKYDFVIGEIPFFMDNSDDDDIDLSF